jgi:hypothetical protein
MEVFMDGSGLRESFPNVFYSGVGVHVHVMLLNLKL